MFPLPLEGIFLRYPYFHNNSIPNLCALLERPDLRPKKWIHGPSQKESDFDKDCIGFPIGDKTPRDWKSSSHPVFNSKKSGLRNIGHSKMLWTKSGESILTKPEKKDLLEFLKTL